MSSSDEPIEISEGRLSIEDAERMASELRPSWELDDGAFAEGDVHIGDFDTLADGGASAGSIDEGADAVAMPARAGATRIDGTPAIVLDASEGPAADAEVPGDAAPTADERAPAVLAPAKKTIVGMGLAALAHIDDQPAPGATSESADTRPTHPEPASSRSAGLRRALASDASADGAPRSAGAPSGGARSANARTGRDTPMSKRMDARPSSTLPGESIDLPMKSSSNGLKLAIAAVAVVALFLGGRALLSPRAPAKPRAPVATAEPPAPVAPAPATAAPTTPPAAPSPAATATAAPAVVTAAPVAPPAVTTPPTAAKPAPAAKPVPPATPKPTATAQKPPAPKPTSTSKPGTGLMRETPF